MAGGVLELLSLAVSTPTSEFDPVLFHWWTKPGICLHALVLQGHAFDFKALP